MFNAAAHDVVNSAFSLATDVQSRGSGREEKQDEDVMKASSDATKQLHHTKAMVPAGQNLERRAPQEARHNRDQTAARCGWLPLRAPPMSPAIQLPSVDIIA